MKVEVFRAGAWTDSAGVEKEWTAAELEEIALTYNSQDEHEAPVVIGHPSTDSPAYGWVKRLESVGGSLWAEIEPTASEFVEWVKSGLYKKVSVAFYGDNTLRHVGFLGANPPAVKGLAPIEFACGGEGGGGYYAEWSIKEGAEGAEETMEGAIKGAINSGGGSTDDPGVEINSRGEHEECGAHSPYDPAGSVARLRKIRALGGHRRTTDALERELRELRWTVREYGEALARKAGEAERLSARVREYEGAIKRIEYETRRGEFERFLSETVAPGALTDSQREFITRLYDHLAGGGSISQEPVQARAFEEGEKPSEATAGATAGATSGEFDPVEGLKEFAASLKPPVRAGEIATPERALDTGDLNAKVREYAGRGGQNGGGDAYEEYEAMKAALRNHPELRS